MTCATATPKSNASTAVPASARCPGQQDQHLGTARVDASARPTLTETPPEESRSESGNVLAGGNLQSPEPVDAAATPSPSDQVATTDAHSTAPAAPAPGPNPSSHATGAPPSSFPMAHQATAFTAARLASSTGAARSNGASASLAAPDAPPSPTGTRAKRSSSATAGAATSVGASAASTCAGSTRSRRQRTTSFRSPTEAPTPERTWPLLTEGATPARRTEEQATSYASSAEHVPPLQNFATRPALLATPASQLSALPVHALVFRARLAAVRVRSGRGRGGYGAGCRLVRVVGGGR